jgi:hypothetical protein
MLDGIKLSAPSASAELTEVTGNIKAVIEHNFLSGDLIRIRLSPGGLAEQC